MGLNLLNSPLAWGALAFCIPLILHILNRSRFRRVEWGAMHLLDSVVKVNHRRFQIEQLLLLLVRCLIPAILAFTLARPVLSGAQAPTGNTPTSMVVVLDTSYSMQASSEDGTRFDQAVTAATKIIRSLPRGSDVAVIQSGGAARSLLDTPVFDTDAVCRRLNAIDANLGASHFRESIDSALTTLAAMNHTRRELVLISDFQSADWNDERLAADVRSQADALSSFTPELTLISVGDAVSGNISVEAVSVPQRPVGKEQPFLVRTELRNRGTADVPQARVFVDVDGTAAAVSEVSLAGSSATQTTFPITISDPGSHIISVRLEVDDALAADNTASVAMKIWDSVDVLLVDGDPISEPLQSETDFLSVALTPFRFGRVRLSDLVRTQTASHRDNLKKKFEAGPKAVILANVPRLTDAQANALQKYVHSGGAVLITSGSRMDVEWYNRRLLQERELLPAKIGELRTVPQKESGVRIQAERFAHPALEYFNDPANGDLTTAEFHKWFQLASSTSRETSLDDSGEDAKWLTASLRDESSVPSAELTVLARLANGDPLLIQRRVGEGVVTLLTSSCDDDWCNLPLQPAYVPLMQQLIVSMATRLTADRNILTGETAVAFFEAKTETPEDTMELTVTHPDGTGRSVTAVLNNNRYVMDYADTVEPGVYQVSAVDLPTSHFVAATARSESQLLQLGDDQLKILADEMDAGLVTDGEAYLKQDRLRRNGWEIWRYALIALLVFLFLELALQQRFARVRA